MKLAAYIKKWLFHRTTLLLVLVLLLSPILVQLYQIGRVATFLLRLDVPPRPTETENDRPLAKGIPKKIHQTWKTNNTQDFPVTASNVHWQLDRRYKDYQWQLWTDADLDRLIQREYPWLYPTYRSYPLNIQRGAYCSSNHVAFSLIHHHHTADIARYVILHYAGGIYVDLDVYPSDEERWRDVENTLDIFVDHRSSGRDNGNSTQQINNGDDGTSRDLVLVKGSEGRVLTNHFMMASAKSDFLWETLKLAVTPDHECGWLWASGYLCVFWSTGPLLVSHSYMRMKDKGRLHARTEILTDERSRRFFHHGAGRSWHQWDGILLNWIADDPMPVLWMLVVMCLCLRWRQQMAAGRRYALVTEEDAGRSTSRGRGRGRDRGEAFRMNALRRGSEDA